MALGRLKGMPLSRPPRDHRRALITFGWAFLPAGFPLGPGLLFGLGAGPGRPHEATMAGQCFEQEILGRLSWLGEVSARPMIGGHGLYWRGVIFAIAHGERLYFKVDERPRPDYLARGMGSLRPNERQTLKSYFEVPPDVLADQEELLSGAREAIQAGQISPGRARTGKERGMRWP